MVPTASSGRNSDSEDERAAEQNAMWNAFINGAIKNGPCGDKPCPDVKPNIIQQKIEEFGDWLSSLPDMLKIGDDFDASSKESMKKLEKVEDNAKEVKKTAAVGKNISEGKVTPYLSISIGKQSTETGWSNIYPGYYQLTLSPGGIDLESGYDYSISPSQLSISVSSGIKLGSSNAPGFGTTFGARNIGVEAGSSFTGTEQYFGVVLSTAKAWGSVSVGQSVPLLEY